MRAFSENICYNTSARAKTFFESEIPMEKIFKIIDMSVEGDGIAKIDDEVYFISGAVEGETVTACIDREKDNLHWGRVTEVQEPSFRRAEPLCPYFSTCGGCKLMHLKEETQRLFKRLSLQRTIKKVTNLDIEAKDTIYGASSVGYRNSMQLKVEKQNGQVVVGFYQLGTHNLVDVDKCLMCGDYSAKVISAVRQFVADTDADFESVFVNYYEGKLLVLVQTSSGQCSKDFYDYLKRDFECVSLWSAKQFATSTLLNYKDAKFVAGDVSEEISLCGVQFEVTPLNFTQINFEVTEKLYTQVATEVGHGNVVLDLYSGVGITSVLFAQNNNYVCSVEYVAGSVESAKKTAQKYGVADKIIHHAGDCAQVMHTLEFTDLEREHLVAFLDPPRKGAGKQVMEELIKLKPQKILYMSCNPTSFAKDLRELLHDYNIEYVQCFDMFPNTNSIESLTLLTKK